ncbi:hypothetical protein J3L16_08195 [Alteromonas sp. 5E99-2]|uniref:hypothetical protein n=1 Tax=Alteromonas sp. 5E99-2 TaxID=2817683 RepID=UPI001A994EF2|nr:hypothetical protein [Alteromonas sp. 5E99-2]MBO1255661.1 hypothetical protein [Alteromonas sp. 5E99-2]
MNIKNLLLITATVFSVSTMANAESFGLGFNTSDSSDIVEVEVQTEQLPTKNTSTDLVLGFNDVSKSVESKIDLAVEKSIIANNEILVNKIANGFQIGFTS